MGTQQNPKLYKQSYPCNPLHDPSFHFIFHFLFHLILHYSRYPFHRWTPKKYPVGLETLSKCAFLGCLYAKSTKPWLLSRACACFMLFPTSAALRKVHGFPRLSLFNNFCEICIPSYAGRCLEHVAIFISSARACSILSRLICWFG